MITTKSKLAVVFTGVVLSTLSLSGVMVQADEATVRQTLQSSYYDKLNDLSVKYAKDIKSDGFDKDMKTLIFELSTDDVKTTTLRGEVITREKMRAQKIFEGDMEFKNLRNMFNVVDTVALEENENRALVTSLHTLAATIALGDGTTHEIAGLNKLLDTWVKTDKGWKLKESKVVWEANSMDGMKVSQMLPEPKK